MGKIHKNIDELYGLDMELVEKLGGLDCKEHGSRLALNKDVVNRKISAYLDVDHLDCL